MSTSPQNQVKFAAAEYTTTSPKLDSESCREAGSRADLLPAVQVVNHQKRRSPVSRRSGRLPTVPGVWPAE
jgi:hypothetical protein